LQGDPAELGGSMADMSMVTNVSASDFDAEVLKSTEPVLVDFWAPWCGPCLRLATAIDDVCEELAGQVKFVKVNVDVDGDLANRFEVRGIPNLVLFKNGKPVDRIIGMTSRQTISDTILRHVDPPLRMSA
jgi:thioredoxin 1